MLTLQNRLAVIRYTVAVAVMIAAGCHSSNNSPSGVHAAGDHKTLKSRALEAGADVLQSTPPVDQINMYLNGIHFYADNIGRQVEAHHYCTHINEDFHQCVIYDGNDKHAKLIGIEYIISEKLFKQLPEEERKFWHSYQYEVKSGELVMPGVPEGVEIEAMEKLATIYGKTWHTWQIDRGDDLPYGIPQLMMAFTADGQVNKDILAGRDYRMKISTEKKREQRQSIPISPILPGANTWQSTETPQLPATNSARP